MADTNKKKIAILGGGMASLTAAHELTDYEGWQDNYEITVYQQAGGSAARRPREEAGAIESRSTASTYCRGGTIRLSACSGPYMKSA
jgi:glycine/D-amino acid oxidase-like deaminating enzyme